MPGVSNWPIALNLACSSPSAFSALVLIASVSVSICSFSKKLIPVPVLVALRKLVSVAICLLFC
jgi:hypothetical protein